MPRSCRSTPSGPGPPRFTSARGAAPPLVTSEIANYLYAVVNVNVLENVDPSRLRRAAASFEGEDVESRLARRVRNWIADVRIADGQNLTTPALRATPPQDEEGK
jgi:hypothetical protein